LSHALRLAEPLIRGKGAAVRRSPWQKARPCLFAIFLSKVPRTPFSGPVRQRLKAAIPIQFIPVLGNTLMTIHSQVFKRLVIGTFLASIPLGMANAQDVNVVAERFKAVLAEQNIDVSWTSVTSGPSSMVLEGVKIGPKGAEKPAEIGKLSFEGIAEDAGAFDIDSIRTEPYSTTEDGATVSIGPISVTGVKLPAAGDTTAMSSILFYDGLEAPSFSVKVADKTAFSMENLAITVTEPADGKPMEFSGGAEKFSADLTLVEDAQSKAVIEALGYQTINGDFEMNGSWNPADGKMEIAQYDITVENAGTFGMTTDIGGYTTDFIKSLRDMQKQMAEAPAGGDNSAQGMAMLGLMQQLTFNSASIRWDDDSLTGKVVDYVAKSQNMKPEDIKNQAKAIVPFLTGQLNNPELSGQITAAVNKFMDDPQSIEVAAAPAAPVPFAQIMAAGMSNPLDLTKTLGLTVTANED